MTRASASAAFLSRLFVAVTSAASARRTTNATGAANRSNPTRNTTPPDDGTEAVTPLHSIRGTSRSSQHHHHSAAAARASTATTKAPMRGKRLAPMDSGHLVEADREKISSSRPARVCGRTAGGYEGGAGRRRRAAGLVTCAPRAAPPTPSACEYWEGERYTMSPSTITV
ncbi:hypothetical protein HMPREF1980_00378 [Actinomyces sp. oral taxon 172 str. F0311]|nr:hypothetical protein HMPREF1980_00378 [Actinomyces sp. oral taxon 172 str. F0311]